VEIVVVGRGRLARRVRIGVGGKVVPPVDGAVELDQRPVLVVGDVVGEIIESVVDREPPIQHDVVVQRQEADLG
jgi:hypothetical protein